MSDHPKSTTPAQESSYPAPPIMPYPHQAYNPAAFPPPGPGGYAPPMLAYPPPPDGSHPEGQNGTVPAPYMIPFPPGLVYAYPPHPQPPGFAPPPPSAASSSTATRPKRQQVKMACTNCANACKRCDENRPCERCVKYGQADSCVDGIRKERKKGVKRGPYKRKSKDNKGEQGEQEESGSFNSSEWPNGQQPSPPPASASAPPVPPTASAPPQYAPEGYYHIYYPPPGAFIPHPPDGQPAESAPHPNGQHVVPYFLPGPYAPFHYPQIYPHPGVHPQPPNGITPSQPTSTQAQTSGTEAAPTTINPADASRKPDDSPGGAVVDPALSTPTVTTGKKRSRTTKSGEPKSKKMKAAPREKGDEPLKEQDGDKSV